MIRARRFISFKTPVSVAIDCTDLPYYGKKDNPELLKWLIGTSKQKGTSMAFRFITLCIVLKGRRFTVAVLPVNKFDAMPDLVERLIRSALKTVRIERIYLDRGFYSVDVIKKLEDMGMGYVMPIVKHKAKNPDKDIVLLIKKNYGEGKDKFVFTMGTKYSEVSFTVVIIKRDDDKNPMGFATNTKISSKSIDKMYGKRWGIETGYAVKNKFRMPTCIRKSMAVRLLFTMIPFVIYNLWVLVNVFERFLLGNGRFLKNNESYVTTFYLRKMIEGLILSIP